MYPLLKPFLFSLPPEWAHHLSFAILSQAQHLGLYRAKAAFYRQPKSLLGMTFPNPVGVAAGLDKNAQHLSTLLNLGFGFVEVGTVTPLAQPGNERPRLFRLSKEQAIINRMGFNNLGVEQMVARLKTRPKSGVVGVNIGKNKQTPLELAHQDYLACLEACYLHCDYLTVNLSSPNTPGLRALQSQAYLGDLLSALKNKQQELAKTHGVYRPVLVKIAPDLDDHSLNQMLPLLLELMIDGVIATNTTVDHSSVVDHRYAQQTGGLSGKPLLAKSNDILKQVVQGLQGKMPVIAVGGIMTPEDAQSKFDLGADLIQLYSGLIYSGPSLLTAILKH